jgi:Helix-turn-helix.
VQKNNVTQKELAEYLCVQRNAISRYENDEREPEYDILVKMADYFSVSTDYLLGRTDEKSSGTDPELEGLEGIDFAFMGDYKDLTERDKETIRWMAKQMKERGT